MCQPDRRMTARDVVEDIEALLEKLRRDGHILWAYTYVKERLEDFHKMI